ncbi:hypothetical protein J5N97_021094 [Dioscorea zingiberensis]|uniref:phosphatidylserine decarboxylase n=1 Tax=Dioscorea zingiberensis TaxID=325984 RepID=A0A9D5CJ93_9LILI|nr:hypothetical protein J5N97_021094 [Dioscorea zingiberensis]
MGNESSRGGSGVDVPEPSFFSRFRRRFLRRRSPSPGPLNVTVAEDFAGIARIELISAEMQFKDRWLACLSLGERTYKTVISDHTDKPVWKSEKKIVLEKHGPHIARISVFETNRLSKNNLVGYCEIDLLEVLTQDSEDNIEVLDLFDASSSDKIVGSLTISCYVEDPIETEKSFVRRVLAVVDYNEDGKLSYSEFSDLINAFGNQVATSKKEELFKQADKNGDGVVDMDELAILLAVQQEKESLISSCPVCGEALENFTKINAGTGNQIMTGGFLTDRQASYGWMFKLSEWAHFYSYDIGLNSGSSASHILVIDRRSKRLVEELIDGKIVMSMRAIYQSKIGLILIDTGAKEILQSLSEKQGRKMNSSESAKDIPKFLEFFKDQIKLDEIKYPIEHFKRVKARVRPIAYEELSDIAVCAADSRLMAFKSVDDSLRLWIKGRKFSIQGLLGADLSSEAFLHGSLVIFRLAPQDYHRFHVPVSGVIESSHEIPGCLYTVNPIAVNSKYCNVFTENKRVVSIISTSEFGKVAFVSIGATMVGSITFVKKQGDYVHKGDEFGYFSFGGSTVICIFEKDAIKIDDDLLTNSERSLETLVAVGMKLGISTRKQGQEELPSLEKCSIDA